MNENQIRGGTIKTAILPFEGEFTYTRVWQNKNGKWRIVSGTAVQQLNTLYIFFLKKQKLAEKHSFLCKLGLLKLHNDSSLNAILQNIF
ncbi:hypothetical protein P8850_18840 [Bacillus inaquosorum]|uniref:hypothetical protein n=1 Tax=Bacillus inaquosorum TaxID=483913 RepID=UPI002282B804|nr:hypothetical protein [Bacillus inaquosorum]MCY8723670.1 nuclear transport factor 2 family protein [Bacillus inaquosorum]MCY9014213.1 nuclear transport factor 2 family protein [Bacillus inaquosorum]MCY9041451.1 nuclear transport factor 2 family protein [Bacillus inaquosorum]MCY9104129.1 nuclear transport factor 2 family protein [Bacillus inaquosorum]MCY9122906.1 nuclear transport factor 2 family protein [Bacillus inaquosorum]